MTGFSGNGQAYINCLSYANSGATSDGFAPANLCTCLNCVAYNNGRDGFRSTNADVTYLNCLAEGNVVSGAFGFNDGSARPSVLLLNCAGFNNGAAGASNVGTNLSGTNKGFIAGTASFFTNPGRGDFSLNTTVGGGAVARAAGTLGFGARGVFPAGLTTTYLDLGAAQHADPVSAGFTGIIGGGL